MGLAQRALLNTRRISHSGGQTGGWPGLVFETVPQQNPLQLAYATGLWASVLRATMQRLSVQGPSRIRRLVPTLPYTHQPNPKPGHSGCSTEIAMALRLQHPNGVGEWQVGLLANQADKVFSSPALVVVVVRVRSVTMMRPSKWRLLSAL